MWRWLTAGSHLSKCPRGESSVGADHEPTVKQAAQREGVSPQMIYRLCEERRLPHYRIGSRGRRGKILIDEADLAGFLASCKVVVPAAPGEPPADSVPPGQDQATPAGGFTMLDGGRLLDAGRPRGALGGRTEDTGSAR
jgi:excisionase family DNA binding protein